MPYTFESETTGIRVMRQTETSDPERPTRKSVALTEVFTGLRLVEPIRGKYKTQLIDEYGYQQGSYYLISFYRGESAGRDDDVEVGDWVYFNALDQGRGLPFDPSKRICKVQIKHIDVGSLTIGCQEAVCVTSN